MAEVRDNHVQEPVGSSLALKFSPELREGSSLFHGNPGSQRLVDERLGGATVVDGSIHISAADKAQTSEVIPWIDNGCQVVKGDHAVKTEDQLTAEGADALNRPAKGSGEPPRDQKEKDAVETIASNTKDDPDYDLRAIQKALVGLDKEQTQRVLDAVNNRLAGTGFKYAETQDGAVWLGYKQPDGTYKPTEYMRPPECSVG